MPTSFQSVQNLVDTVDESHINQFIGPVQALQEGLTHFGGTSTGTSSAYVVSPSPQPSLAAGNRVVFIPHVANAGAATLNVAATGAVPIQLGGQALAGGELVPGAAYVAYYTGSSWSLIGARFPSENPIVWKGNGIQDTTKRQSGADASRRWEQVPTGYSYGWTIGSYDILRLTGGTEPTLELGYPGNPGNNTSVFRTWGPALQMRGHSTGYGDTIMRLEVNGRLSLTHSNLDNPGSHAFPGNATLYASGSIVQGAPALELNPEQGDGASWSALTTGGGQPSDTGSVIERVGITGGLLESVPQSADHGLYGTQFIRRIGSWRVWQFARWIAHLRLQPRAIATSTNRTILQSAYVRNGRLTVWDNAGQEAVFRISGNFDSGSPACTITKLEGPSEYVAGSPGAGEIGVETSGSGESMIVRLVNSLGSSRSFAVDYRGT